MRWQGMTMIGAAAIAVGLGAPVLAQEGTPTAGSNVPASCDAVEPRDAEYFAELARSPEATPADEDNSQAEQGAEASPVTAELPQGEPADEATIGEVSTLYGTLIDCLNQADYLRAYALYTDEYLLSNLSAEALSQLEATPVPVEESTETEFGGVLEARTLEDGSVVALVTTNNPSTGEVLIKSTMTRGDEGLRIADEAIVAAETPATPEG